MNSSEALNKLLPSYKSYFDIKTENVTPPFTAEAEFHSHNEQYILIKAAKIASMDSHEYVFFAADDSQKNLTSQKFIELDKIAWETGISRVNPVENHKNSDVTLILLFDTIEPEAEKLIKKAKHSKTYMLGFRGYSNYSVIALSLSDNKIVYNRFGRNYKKLVSGIL